MMPSLMERAYKRFKRTCYYIEIGRDGCYRKYRTDCGMTFELSYDPSEVERAWYCSNCGKRIRVITRRG